ncbi:MAG: hypothetical protein AAB909_02775 [Patescibacteria group bacterium]
MAAKKKAQSDKVAEVQSDVVVNEENLDPQEEKVLDWILKGIVIFILAWLGLSVLLVIGGLFGVWK